MSRKQFIESHGATCKNWRWSWSFVNQREKLIIFGEWEGTGGKILDEDWEMSPQGRKSAFPESIEHVRLVEEEGYQLMTFPMVHSNTVEGDVESSSKIDSFTGQLTPKGLVKRGHAWYASATPQRGALDRWKGFTRRKAHDLLAPSAPFTPQRGQWGLQGIVPLLGRPGDFVFFVTFGQSQGEHSFDEGVTGEGVLTWQSQPRQSATSPQIQQFINHDDLVNSIYLLLRTKREGPYTYLGRLRYLTHDAERENPVYFQWQILDWDPPVEVSQWLGLTQGVLGEPPASSTTPTVASGLTEAATPTGSGTKGISTASFKGKKSSDRSEQDQRNRKLGLAGEQLVIGHETDRLNALGLPDLAAAVRHVAVEEGDGAGYDVLSFAPDRSERFIEVKTTRGPASTPFFISPNEVAFSAAHAEQFELWRVYEYDGAAQGGHFYRVAGDVRQQLTLRPSQYRATLPS